MRHERASTALLLVGSLLLGACTGDDDANDGSAAPDQTLDETAGEQPLDTPDLDEDDGDDEGGGGGLSSSVTVTEGEGLESSVEVRVGETISSYDGVVTSEGTELSIPSQVLFAVDESTLLPEAEARLDDIVEVLEFYPDAPVEIVGHTDSDGAADYNQDLSERRAQAVADYVTAAGVDASRLTVVGRGETDPVATNNTAEGKQQNRRVEILIRGVEPPETD
ncbi:OmpA family protein [Nitriliruptor alkaliphilus]|uniref:OmpA family protein n=1 Tax=Nitriliruptor alkaliphilus TaxID=427918 RepID=UPI0006970DE1|nr:OmpA family protein [Nitriliruptor alkaliphilus]